MSSRLEDLRDLAQLLDEGKISQQEFEVVKTELLEASPEEWAELESSPELSSTADSNGSSSDAEPTEDSSAAELDWLTFVRQIPTVYWVSAALSVLVGFYGGRFPPVAWVAAASSSGALVMRKEQNGRWMAWTGLGLGIVFSLLGILTSGTTAVEAGPLPASATGPQPLTEIPVGSLAVRFADIQQGWNAIDDPPYVLKGISTTPEAGPLDSFIYRFDGGAVLAGAYNPSDGYVYALMAKSGIFHDSVSTMYVHLCYLLYPGTQECFDAYVEESGVFGRPVEDLEGIDHHSSWRFDGNEWRLDIVDDVQTIRVLGPQEAG